jgi:carbamoyl-phosphate synthase large subunit
MRSTGEVMGIDAGFGTAFAKAQAGAFGRLPTSGGCSSRWPTGTSGT